jgi:hypothetical protein
MKNITLSVDDEVIAAVRRYAAEQGSSLNALVREYLGRLAEREDRARTARKRIRELSEQSTARIGDERWSRDELHER